MSSGAVRDLLDVFRTEKREQNALSMLSTVNDPTIIKDIRDVDMFDMSLLHWAAARGWLDVVKLLVTKYNCDPYQLDSRGCTILDRACYYNHTDIVRYLISECCMDPLEKNTKGKTPLDRSKGEARIYIQGLVDEAKRQGFKDVVEYLKERRETLQKYETALAEAMEEGGGYLFLSNIILHGPPGSGKSSVKALILGQPPLPKHKQNATDILEKSVRAVCTNRIAASTTSGLFEVVDNDQIIERLAGEVEKHREKKIDKPISSIHAVDKVSSKDGLSHILSDSKAESSTATPVLSVEAPTKEALLSMIAVKSIRKKLPNAKTFARMFDSHWHHYVDSGGQPQFLDVLPLLYRSPSHFIVVMRLTEGLDEKPKVRFYNQGNDVYELPDHLVLTNREVVVQICQIAQSIAQATSGKFVPRVFVVGTHIDQLWFFSRSKTLQNLNEGLAPLYKIYSDVMICKSPTEFIFPVNAIAKEKEREQYTEEIQQHILLATKKAGCPIQVPLKWLTFHLELDKRKGVVRMSECYEIGKKLGMEEDRVHLALEFLNQAALILYYPVDVPDLVLTKMDPFTNRLSRLIKASFIPPDNGPAKESIELREKGVFKKSFLKKAFHGIQEGLISDDEFLKLLESLKVAVHIGEEEYFLPSALSLNPPPEVSSFKCESIPLVLSWGDLILPHGFFLTVTVELLEHSSIKDSEVFELRTDTAQWRGEIQVSEAKRRIPGVVKLTDRKRWIQVSYSSDNRYCSLVLEHVEGATQRAIKRFQHTGIEPPTVGYLCPLCDKKDHYCVPSADWLFITCSENNSKTGPVTPDMTCWTQATGKRVELPSGYDEQDEQDGPIPGTLCQTRDQSLIVSPVDDSILSASNDNLLAVLRSTIEVIDWFTLGLTLGLASHELERIKLDGYDERERQRRMVSLWLDTGDASWKALVQALIDPLVNKEELAKRISEQHPLTH